jgi:hypothetical protein
MAFTFLRSYQPELEHPEEEEDEMPIARSGSVRAFSHLPCKWCKWGQCGMALT